MILNQIIKYYKYGFGRVNDYCNEGIRFGTMTREEGVNLIEKYEGQISDNYIKDFCEYIDIPLSLFWERVNSIMNHELFYIDDKGKIKRKFEVGKGI